MANKCCVPFCPNVYKKGGINAFSLHKFPREARLRQAWIDAIAEENLEIKPLYSKVCSDHFLPSDFKTLKDHGVRMLIEESNKNGSDMMHGYHVHLEKWAVPSQWPGK